MADHRVAPLGQELRQDDLVARRSAGTIVALPLDAFLAVRRGVVPGQMGPWVAVSPEGTFALLTARPQAAERQAQMGAKERPVAASGCSVGR